MNSTNKPIFFFERVRNIIMYGVRRTNDARATIISPKRRKLENDAIRCAYLVEHEKDMEQCSAFGDDEHGISVYNPIRIWRSRDWRIFQKPEQKLYSFCFDKRIILTDSFDTLPYGFK
jgi:hypothetical protein